MSISVIVLSIYERLPRWLRVWILISIIPFGFSFYVATGYYGYSVFRELRG